VERLWQTIKYEEVYLHTYDSVLDTKAGLARTSICTTGAGRIAR
jgi:hypothetical protein